MHLTPFWHQEKAIGSMMIITPPGASRQYTLPYYDFVNRIETDPTMSRCTLTFLNCIEADPVMLG
eukprot:scaffold40190_cov21-Tisochrysis_lutea.AAC.2